ncbi:hypothetical protein C0J52_15831 [Blattella germanica]|nr:hypothetical protein C0J52_15831 [Blattella germanica]
MSQWCLVCLWSDQPRIEFQQVAPAPFYDFIPGLGYYKLHTKPKTWIEAKWTCEREGAHLALVKTPKVIDVLQELRRRLPGLHRDWRDDYLWIGVNHISEYGIWETIFGMLFGSNF